MVVAHAVVDVSNVWLLPRAVVVAPVQPVHPVGRPVPILLKSWVYGDVPKVTCAEIWLIAKTVAAKPNVRSVKNFFMGNGLEVSGFFFERKLKQPNVSDWMIRPYLPFRGGF